jgi:hypothetical protein
MMLVAATSLLPSRPAEVEEQVDPDRWPSRRLFGITAAQLIKSRTRKKTTRTIEKRAREHPTTTTT